MADVEYINRLFLHDEQKAVGAPITRPEKQLTDGLAK